MGPWTNVAVRSVSAVVIGVERAIVVTPTAGLGNGGRGVGLGLGLTAGEVKGESLAGADGESDGEATAEGEGLALTDTLEVGLVLTLIEGDVEVGLTEELVSGLRLRLGLGLGVRLLPLGLAGLLLLLKLGIAEVLSDTLVEADIEGLGVRLRLAGDVISLGLALTGDGLREGLTDKLGLSDTLMDGE